VVKYFRWMAWRLLLLNSLCLLISPPATSESGSHHFQISLSGKETNIWHPSNQRLTGPWSYDQSIVVTAREAFFYDVSWAPANKTTETTVHGVLVPYGHETCRDAPVEPSAADQIVRKCFEIWRGLGDFEVSEKERVSFTDRPTKIYRETRYGIQYNVKNDGCFVHFISRNEQIPAYDIENQYLETSECRVLSY
jgi:hypothetical protein